MIYDIVQVVPFEDYTVYVYFEDGKIVCYDAKPLLDKKVFEPLRDKDFFLNSCTILNGTLAWDVTGTRDRPDSCAVLPVPEIYRQRRDGGRRQGLSLHQPHRHFHQQGHHHERGEDKSVQHGAKARFLHFIHSKLPICTGCRNGS